MDLNEIKMFFFNSDFILVSQVLIFFIHVDKYLYDIIILFFFGYTRKGLNLLFIVISMMLPYIVSHFIIIFGSFFCFGVKISDSSKYK